MIKEGLRLTYGVPGRLLRVVPETGAEFCGQKIPAGVSPRFGPDIVYLGPSSVIYAYVDNLILIQTLVTSSAYIHNMNPSVFPSPDEFRPERWLDGDPRLDKHMCSFSRGSRICIGKKYVFTFLPFPLTVRGIFCIHAQRSCSVK